MALVSKEIISSEYKKTADVKIAEHDAEKAKWNDVKTAAASAKTATKEEEDALKDAGGLI